MAERRNGTRSECPLCRNQGPRAVSCFSASFVQVKVRDESHHFVETSADGRRELFGRQGALAEADQGLHRLLRCPLEPARMII